MVKWNGKEELPWKRIFRIVPSKGRRWTFDRCWFSKPLDSCWEVSKVSNVFVAENSFNNFFTRIAKTKTIELHSTWSSSAVECMGRLKNIERERESVCLCVCGVRECVWGEMEGGLLPYWGKSVCEKDLSATLKYQRVRASASVCVSKMANGNCAWGRGSKRVRVRK